MANKHLKKLINLFYKGYLDKFIATSKIINTVSLIAKLTIRPTALKQKQDWLVKPAPKPTALKQKQDWLSGNNINKKAKKNWAMSNFYYVFGLFWSAGNLCIKTLSLNVA